MPARFLPNSDVQRTSALDLAFIKRPTVAADQQPVSQDLADTLIAQRTTWRAAINAAATALSAQTKATAAAATQGQRLEMFISHFFQTFNLAVARDDFPASARAFYQLEVSNAAVPPVITHADRLTWAQNIIDGETARATADGAAYKPMKLPSAAGLPDDNGVNDNVAAELAAYLPLTKTASTAKDAYDTAQETVQNLRPAVDAVIVDVWDAVEYFHRHDDASSLRRKASEWGVVYITRPGETPAPAPTPTPTPPPA